MKISNLHLEHAMPFEYGYLQTRIICDIESNFTDVKHLWFSVDEHYSDWLTDDVYDAFLVALLYPSMYYGEDIEICGNVSKRLYYNIMQYVQGVVLAYDDSFHRVDVKVQGFANAKKVGLLHVGTGFSGGVDSFSTLRDNFFNMTDVDYKIDKLFFFHVGQYGNVKKKETWERARNRFSITYDFAKEIGVDAIMMNTNLFDIYLPFWEYDAGVLCRIASVLVFQKKLRRYYISNTISYKELAQMNLKDHHVDMAEISDPIIMPLLSPEGLDIVCDGAQYTRTEKILNISSLNLAQKHLNVCVNSSDEHIDATNCSYCPKCLRTLMALESADVLPKFSGVFDLKQWKKRAFLYKCEQVFKYSTDAFAQDNVDFAKKRGKKVPNAVIAYLVCMTCRLLLLPKWVWHKLKKL